MNQDQAWLASLKNSGSYQWGFLIGLLKPIIHSRWKNPKKVTLLEFGFILSGYEPIPNKIMSKVVEELRTILYQIKPSSFQDMHNDYNEDLLKSVRELFPNIKQETEIVQLVMQQAQALLNCLETIHRGSLTIPKEHQACFATEQGKGKEKLWRFDYLVYWARTDLLLSLPAEICVLNKKFNIKKELGSHFITNEVSISEPKKEKKPDPRRINSHEKLSLGLALKLGYNPNNTKNTATGSNQNGFSSILSEYGIDLDEDTIRNLLKTASQKHPHSTKTE